jgi:glycosyltransferase involved in cell wall biosynthesis
MRDQPKEVTQRLSELLLFSQRSDVALFFSRLLMSRNRLSKQLFRLFTQGKHSAADMLLQEFSHALGSHLPEETASLLRADFSDGVGIYGFFRSESGLGQSARRSASSFRTTDIPISLHNFTDDFNFKNIVEFDASEDLVSNHKTLLIHLNSDALMALWSQFPHQALIDRKRIGFWHWELPVFPLKFAPALELVHEIWAPSRYVADTIRPVSDVPVRVVPHAAEPTGLSTDQARLLFGLPLSDFIFLTIFDSNSYIERKNPIGVVRAFQDAFPSGSNRDVRLVVKLHGRGYRGDRFRELCDLCARDDRIVVIDALFHEPEIRALQAACDAYVSLHRAEGYGLNIIESMAEGKLAIATAFSGNMQFMSSDNAILVPHGMQAVRSGEYLHGDGQWWANPDHDAAVEAIRLAPGSSASKRLAVQARNDIAERFSYKAIGELSVKTLRGETD